MPPQLRTNALNNSTLQDRPYSCNFTAFSPVSAIEPDDPPIIYDIY